MRNITISAREDCGHCIKGKIPSPAQTHYEYCQEANIPCVEPAEDAARIDCPVCKGSGVLAVEVTTDDLLSIISESLMPAVTKTVGKVFEVDTERVAKLVMTKTLEEHNVVKNLQRAMDSSGLRIDGLRREVEIIQSRLNEMKPIKIRPVTEEEIARVTRVAAQAAIDDFSPKLWSDLHKTLNDLEVRINNRFRRASQNSPPPETPPSAPTARDGRSGRARRPGA